MFRQQYQQHPRWCLQWIKRATATTVLVGSSLLLWRVVQPEQFDRVWQTIDLPICSERQIPKQKER